MKIKLLIINLILITLFACRQNGNNNQLSESKMNLKENAEIKKTIESLNTGMIEYIEPGETEYSEKDVEKCMKLIDSFLTDLSESDNKESGMEIIEKTVLKLNELNAKCEYELIETNQREQLAEIIILAGHLKGYNERDEDVTEEWREW
jgi:hypothetical protein